MLIGIEVVAVAAVVAWAFVAYQHVTMRGMKDVLDRFLAKSPQDLMPLPTRIEEPQEPDLDQQALQDAVRRFEEMMEREQREAIE